MATTRDMIAAIDEEIARLTRARALLADDGEVGHRAPVTKAGKRKKAAKAADKKVAGRPVQSRRALSPEARERIAAGQRKRWAASKKAAKKASK